jgi:rubredoxin-NAD+ reductase
MISSRPVITCDVIDIAALPLAAAAAAGRRAAARQTRRARRGMALWRGTKSINNDGGALKVTLDNGTTLPADVVLSAVGLKPRTDLARAAGSRSTAA